MLDRSSSDCDAQQAAASEAANPSEEESQQAQDGPPYTLKCANQMGDVRLTSSKPPSPEQKVLYFTAQWERDGGGVYDVSKFVKPEVGSHCNCTYSWVYAVSKLVKPKVGCHCN